VDQIDIDRIPDDAVLVVDADNGGVDVLDRGVEES